MDWSVLLKDYKRYLEFERNLSKNSILAYLNDVHKIHVFCEDHDLPLEGLTAQHLQDFLIWMNSFSISPFTQARLISALKAFFTAFKSCRKREA